MDGSKCQLILCALIKLLMVVHQIFFIIFLVCKVEEKSGLQRSLSTLERLLTSIIIAAKRIITACLVDVVIFIISLAKQLVVDGDALSSLSLNLPIFSHMEVAVGKPETILNLDVNIPLTLQKSNGSNPVPLFDVVLQGRHLLLLDLVELAILSIGVLDLGL